MIFEGKFNFSIITPRNQLLATLILGRIEVRILLFRETQLDKKILSGLLKGKGMELKHQLYLSMIWDRIDIAEEKIFANGK